MEQQIVDFLKKNKIDLKLEKPKKKKLGDFSLACFPLTKKLRKNPVEIAKEIAQKLDENKPDFIDKIEAVGGYINFFINKEIKAKSVIESLTDLFKIQDEKKYVIEMVSPNTNKPLHLGHVRNIFIGNALYNILKRSGNEVYRVCLYNDRGIAICKAMAAYLEFGNGKTPEDLGMKGDKFVGHFYVMFEKRNKESSELKLEEKAYELLRKWEAGNKEVLELWRKFMDWVYKGYKETYTKYKVEFDKCYYESEIYTKGKEIVHKGLEKGIFQKEDDGAISCDLTDKNLGKKIVLRHDGTSLYITQDIYLAYLKDRDFKADSYIFVVANEQTHHFQVLFEILKRLGFGDVEKNYHFAYGYVLLPEGKMKSREGNVVEADELYEEVVKLAKEEVMKRHKDIDEKELEERARKIAYGALAFFILKYNPLHDFIFNPQESISFEGETGPYVMYTYARIQSLLKKGGGAKKAELRNINEEEEKIINILGEAREVFLEALNKYKISAITNFLIRLCQAYNEFYAKHPILNSEEKEKRLYLSKVVGDVIRDFLELLNIEVLEEM